MRLLITGFEPFGGSPINPSEQVVHALEKNPPGSLELFTAILPVDRERGPAALLSAIQAYNPQAVLCLGEAARRPVVSVERIAVNLMDYRIPDNSGQQVTDLPVRPEGPAAYFCTLPVREIANAIQTAQVPVELSLSAGAYLCNQVLYELLHEQAAHRPLMRGGFIHLPALPEQVIHSSPQSPSMSLETSLRAVRAAIEVIQASI